MTEQEYHKIIEEKGFQLRTCWNCNSAPNHSELQKFDGIVACFLCGRTYYKGEDVRIDVPRRSRRKLWNRNKKN